MSDAAPPHIGDLPKQSEFQVPQLDQVKSNAVPSMASTNDTAASNAASSVENAKTAVINSEVPAQSAMDTVANHPLTQNVKDTVVNGLNVKDQSEKTSAEAQKLAATRQMPDTRAATGQPLTHYHSFFYSLLAWEQPRVTAISFLGIITAIFVARYMPILRLTFKFLAYTLGTAAAVEGGSQVLLSQSILAAVRPRKYFTIPRESLESTLEDVEQLMNFFVIESQRLIFAEDAFKTFVAFLASFIAYWLIKFTPVWGLTLIGVTTVYVVPLIYISNKETIDEQFANAGKIVNAQTAQVKNIAAQHTANATESLKSYTGDLSKQAQEYIGSARRSISPAAQKVKSSVTPSDFPSAPRQEPYGVTTSNDQASDPATNLATGVPAS